MIWDYFLSIYVLMSEGLLKIITEPAFIVGLVCVLNLTQLRAKDLLRSLVELIVLWLCIQLLGGTMVLLVSAQEITSKVMLFAVYPVIGLSYAVYTVVACKHDIRKQIVLFITYYAVYLYVAGIVGYIVMVLNSYLRGYSVISAIIQAVIFILLYAVLCSNLIMRSLHGIEFFPKFSFWCTFICIVALVAADQTCHVLLPDSYAAVVVRDIVFFVLTFLLYNMLVFTSDEHMKRMSVELNQSKLEDIHSFVPVVKENQMQMRKIYHDMGNQYLYMKQLLNEKKYADLNVFFDEYGGTLEEIQMCYNNTGNDIIDTILDIESAKALKNGIKLSVKAAIPSSFRIAEQDLTRLLMNVFDNAIEGTERTGGDEEKAISGYLRTEGNYLIVHLANPTDTDSARESQSREWSTSKIDKSSHGLGLKIVSDIVECYGGNMVCEVQDRFFIIDIMIEDRDMEGK